VQVLVVDLDEDGAAFGEKFPAQKQPVAQVGQVRVNAERPGVAVGFDLLRLVGDVFVLVLHVAAVNAGLEVAGVPDAVGRVYVDHLHLARHALLDQERVHHQERIPQDQAVRPTDLVAVELDLLVGGQGCFAEEVELRLRLLYHLHDRPRGDALVDVERHHVHLERGVFGFASPDELRVQVGVVGVARGLPLADFVRGRDASGRVVRAPGVSVAEVAHAVRVYLMRLHLAWQ